MCEELWTSLPCAGGEPGLCGERAGEDHSAQEQSPNCSARQDSQPYPGEAARDLAMCGAAGQESVCAVVTGPVPCPSQSWADAFRSSPDLTGVVAVYEDLRRKGLEFPMTDLDMLSPIHTPQRVSRADGLGWGEGVSLLPISPGPDQP